MAITLTTILGWCGVTVAAQKNRIIAEMLSAPEGLEHFNNETTEGLIATFRDYGRRADGDGKIVFSRVQQKRIISLKDWVKDRARLEDDILFENGTTRADFITAIEEASERKEYRSNQKKVGEALITSTFQVQLETAHQWDRWFIELESNLGMIIGARGIALSYVTRDHDAPDLTERLTWDERAMHTAPHTGQAFTQDVLTVHNIVLRNIADGSDAFTYVKPHLKKKNGRTDVQALQGRYENPAMQEQYVNEAKRTLETLTYRNERAMTFEKFVAKFVKAVDELDKRHRGMHNADIVEMIWKKMTNPELSQYVVALKVQFQRQPRPYQEVLQDIASQVSTTPINPFRKQSEVNRSEDNQAGEECPESGAHDVNGKLYTGKYPYHKWKHESVRPHWEEIRAVRSQQGIGGDNSQRRVQGKKREQSELQTKISELVTKQARLEATIASITVDGSATEISDLGATRAGDSFGGRSEREQQRRK